MYDIPKCPSPPSMNSTVHRSNHDLPLCDSVRTIAASASAAADRTHRVKKSASVVRFSSSASSNNG